MHVRSKRTHTVRMHVHMDGTNVHTQAKNVPIHKHTHVLTHAYACAYARAYLRVRTRYFPYEPAEE